MQSTRSARRSDQKADPSSRKPDQRDNKVALLRIPAFLIDATVVVGLLGSLQVLARRLSDGAYVIPAQWIMFLGIPLGFFLYWASRADLGKRLFGLKVVDAVSGGPPTVFQYFKRSLLFSLLVSFNLLFLLPMFLSKRNQGFHDMLANTRVVRRQVIREASGCSPP